MKKTLILFLVFICSLYVVSAADSANIIEDSVNVSGMQGTTASGSFTVNNTGTETVTYSFTSGLSGPGALSINAISDVVLAPTASSSVSLDVPIASNQALGIYTGTINVTNSSGIILDSVPVTVNVTPSFSLNSSISSIIFNNAIRNSTRTATFTITNNGNGNLTGVIPTSSAASKYNVSFNKTSSFSLDVGDSETMIVTVLIPSDEPTTNHSIGSIVMNSDGFNQSVATLNVDVKGGLVVADLDARIYYKYGEKDGDTDVIQSITDGQSLNFDQDVRPGSELRFNVNVENTFTSSEDIDIEDVTVTVTIKEIDDGEDVDEEGDEFDLDPKEEERSTLYFDIPLEVEEGEYNVLIEIEGQDSEGTEHSLEWNLEITVNKERTNIVIEKADLTRDTVSCNRDTRLNVGILNIGSKEEDDMKIEITNSDLDVEFVEDGIELGIEPYEEDDEYGKSLSINVGSDVAAGTYPIKVNAYISSGALFESKTVNLVVDDCGGTQEESPDEDTEEESEEEENVAGEEPEVTEESEEEGTKISVLEESVTETKEAAVGTPLILSLIIAGLTAVGIGVFVVIKFFPKK